ncbi:family 1 glycosylhydrolase [Schlesneria sp. DSM 10557]|uniref:family 1 glycosylhydrolase n=1 Tax=Schlesneria sp. DSM 10557 TaxID=3044399 RepID=UPI0035A044F9
MHGFMFATGIENSYPTIAGGKRIDQMEKCGHYERWEEDLQLVQDLNITYLRWGPALHKVFLGPGRYDWSWFDDVMNRMDEMGILPILDLCHFGVPDWVGNFQNTDFPQLFAEYAGEVARRYPGTKYWTPVNEILITALFSAKYGWWNEMRTDDESFVRATINLCKANLFAMKAILKSVPDAVFIQSESSEYTHPAGPELVKAARFYNERRFIPLDLTYGHVISAPIYRYMIEHGMSESDYNFFMNQDYKFRCIMGTDYYVTNEHLLRSDGSTVAAGEFFGYYVIAKDYYNRYGLPLMHTETNIREESGSVQWLWKEWNTMLRLRQDGVPIVGFTWYSLTDQIDWDVALREENNNVHPVGLYDLDRQPRSVGIEYKRMIQEWRRFLPTGSSALMLV